MKIKSEGHLTVKTVMNSETMLTIHDIDKELFSKRVVLLLRTTNRNQPDLKI